MKKLLLFVFLMSIGLGFSSCENEDPNETDLIYASDKDEEPDRDDRDS